MDILFGNSTIFLMTLKSFILVVFGYFFVNVSHYIKRKFELNKYQINEYSKSAVYKINCNYNFA